MSKLEWIESFINVVEANSFAGAAKVLGISTPAVSRQVNALEQALKTQLLQRSTRRLQLTEVGRQYYEECKKSLAGLQEAEALIDQYQQTPAGQLKVMVSRFFAEQCLLQYLAEFMLRYPLITLHLDLVERLPNVIQEGIDVVMGIGPLNESLDLVQKRLITTRGVMCAAPDYLKKYGIPQTPEDLQKHIYIAHSRRINPEFIRLKNHPGVMVKPALWINDTAAMLDCALRGIGIVYLIDLYINKFIESGQLVEILPDYPVPEMPAYLYYQPSRYLRPKIRHFIDFYVDKLQH